MAGNANSGGHNKVGSQMHVLRGTFRPDRHAGHEAPEPPKGPPKSPKPLTGEALAEWKRMVARLEEAKTISIVDDAALYQYVKLFAETEGVATDNAANRKLSEELKRVAQKLDGAELVDAIGKIVELRKLLAKQTATLRQQRMAIRQYLVEFGMTPSARGRVKVSTKEKSTKDVNKERFFGGRST